MRIVTALVLVLFLLLALPLLVPVVMRVFMAQRIFSDVEKVPLTEVAVILGASVIRGEPSPVLANRTAAALRLYREKKVKKILITGDDGGNGLYDEVTPV